MQCQSVTVCKEWRKNFKLEFYGPVILACLVTMTSLQVACVRVGPDFSLPEVAVNEDWLTVLEHDGVLAQRDAEVVSMEPMPLAWWSIFHDPILERLVRLVRERNISLHVAAYRIAEARAQLAVSIGNFYPYQTLKGDYTWTDPSKVSEYAPQPSTGESYPNYQTTSLGLSASWEPDFWGKYGRLTEAAAATLQASMADFNAAMASVTAEVANVYIQYRTLQEEKDILKRNINIQKENLRIATTRYELGATSELDVEQAKAQLSNTQAQLPAILTSIAKTSNALCTLLAMPPSNMRMVLGHGGIPRFYGSVAVGIPADLLRRRPDVRKAEFQAMAACAQIGATKAELYPSFSLSGFVGFSASNVGAFSTSDIFGQGFTAYGGPSFTWPIFNYGRVVNAVKAKDFAHQAALLTYRNTVLAAMADVENAMEVFLQARAQVLSYEESSRAAEASLKLALAQYRDGASDFTTVLTAAATLASTQQNLAEVQGNVGQGLVALYRALGGGWEVEESCGMEK